MEKTRANISMFPMGPNSMDLPKLPMEFMKELTDNNRRHALTSFAMFARLYRMPEEWSKNNNTIREASQVILLEYRMVCHYTNIAAYPGDPSTSYASDRTTGFLAIFDTAQNVKDKIAYRKKKNIPDEFSGVMVFHVEMDDYAGTCGEGVFPRLYALRSELRK
ncbi:uncharacterized protein [Dermacentor andersoni]|uniref:uncharacterized protein n=1 Tax=Dermacentor andersoni TaxID=34620 RepID=UPI0024171DB2|nr:uncharacterized protein LOC129385381 [Dermacentor andersoni]